MKLHIDVVLAPQTRDDDLDVLLAVARQQKLLGLRIAIEAQAGVLFENLVNGMTHAVFVGTSLGENGIGDGRLRQFDGRIGDGRRFVVQRVAGQGVLQLGHGTDISGSQLRHRAQVLALQDAQVRELLGLAGTGVDQDAVVLQHPRGHLEVGDSSGERIGHGLEDEDAQRFGVAHGTKPFVDTFHRPNC